MAKDSSFDVVSEVDLQEMDNAVNQATKEIGNRYDLKASATEITLDKENKAINIGSENEYTLSASIEVLKGKVIKRDISLKALDFGKVEDAAKSRVRQKINIIQGIPIDKAKAIVKAIKDRKLKVQAAVEGEKVRVTGKSRDDLQSVISLLKEEDFGLPLQFTNYR